MEKLYNLKDIHNMESVLRRDYLETRTANEFWRVVRQLLNFGVNELADFTKKLDNYNSSKMQRSKLERYALEEIDVNDLVLECYKYLTKNIDRVHRVLKSLTTSKRSEGIKELLKLDLVGGAEKYGRDAMEIAEDEEQDNRGRI